MVILLFFDFFSSIVYLLISYLILPLTFALWPTYITTLLPLLRLHLVPLVHTSNAVAIFLLFFVFFHTLPSAILCPF